MDPRAPLLPGQPIPETLSQQSKVKKIREMAQSVKPLYKHEGLSLAFGTQVESQAWWHLPPILVLGRQRQEAP